MQIVIDIPEEVYNDIKATYNGDEVVYDGVKYGTPLPKGHGDLVNDSQGLVKDLVKGDLISRETLIKAVEQGEGISWESYGKDNLCVRKKYIDNAPTVNTDMSEYSEKLWRTAYERGKEWNNHEVACLLADIFGDTCACNYNGNDEWLPYKCDFANKECPDVVGVACWEQFLKHRVDMRGEE